MDTLENILKYKIKDFIENPVEQIELPRLSIGEYESILTELGYKQTDFETNGYQVDFWIYFEKENMPKLCLSGDLWHQKFFKLFVVE